MKIITGADNPDSIFVPNEAIRNLQAQLVKLLLFNPSKRDKKCPQCNSTLDLSESKKHNLFLICPNKCLYFRNPHVKDGKVTWEGPCNEWATS